jgi:hypothetical protein
LDACLNEPSNEGKELSFKHLEATALSVKQCLKMAQDARAGELELIETEEEKQSLLAFLGFKAETPVVPNSSTTEKPGKETSKRRSNKSKQNRPGQRNPKHDPIGIPNL